MTEMRQDNLGTLLPLAGHNIRDLGGIRTADGRTLAPKRLIRGDHLSGLSAADGLMLRDEYQVDLVIDLRRPSEIRRQPDTIIGGVTYWQVPLIGDAAARSAKRKKHVPVGAQMADQVRAMQGGVIHHQTQLYRNAVSDAMTTGALKQIAEKLLKHEQGAVYWHCTAGKDRTGMVSAMVLLALGVDRAAVRAEYLQTNAIIADKVERIADFCAPYCNNDTEIAEIRRWCLVHPDYFDAVMAEIEEKYQTTDDYFKTVLGLDDAARDRLCRLYLI